MESRRPDELTIFGINSHQHSTGFQGLVNKHLEHFFFVAISDRMLFPDELICNYAIKVKKILWSKRPEFEELAFKNGFNTKEVLFSGSILLGYQKM